MIAFCFPSSWSCKPETCLNDNFTLPNGQLVLRDYQRASLGVDASASSNSATAQTTATMSATSATPTGLMTVCATQNSPQSTIAPTAVPLNMVTTSTLTVRSAVVGITVGLPMLIITIIIFTTLVRERWRNKKLLAENKIAKADVESYKRALIKINLEKSWYELSPPETSHYAHEMGSGGMRVEMGSGQSRVPTPHPAKR